MAKGNKYYTNVKPHLDYIKEMRANGATERQIASALKIAYSSFNNYKEQHKELRDALEQGVCELNYTLRGKLYELAMGQTITETKTTIIDNPDGTQTIKNETSEKVILPSQGAIERLLQNNDDEFVTEDKTTRDRKEREITLKEKNSEKEDW